MDQSTELELRALLDRDRILALLNRYVADAVRTPDGWRFQTLNLRPVWSTGQSHFDIEASEP